jgi:malonate-semialdehyde dehydrogenase (acetylating)/methylmalonate-semialdehyde dehydrogenase
MVPLWMFPMAIACGNTFILKPSDKVPRTAVRLVELAQEAGLPAGVLNLVHGAKEAVDVLLADPRVAAVSFVGSSAVARYIHQTASSHGKRVQALGGAKNHSVVLPDADMRSTVAAIMGSGFGCAGERCLATSVVIAVGEAGDPLVRELVQAANSLTVGDGCQARTQMGPVITVEAKKRILGYIELGEKEGAQLARDGRKDEVTRGQGYFVGPTIFDKVDPGSRIAKDEIFGPVLSVIRAKDLKEALAVIAGSEYGNAASIFTRSGAAAREFSQNVTAGMVGINVGVPAPVAFFSFAGWKNSFFGDLHALGKDAVRFYTEQRVVTCRWPE